MGKNGCVIKIKEEVKKYLDNLKVIPREPYNDVIIKLINFYLKNFKKENGV